jgi:polyisoprenoid-binding protein YceI
MKRILLTGCLAVWCAWAAPARGQSPVEKIDVQTSRVYVFVAKKGAGHDHGVEGRLTAGAVRLGAAANAGELTFDLLTFQADTDAARRYVGLPPGTDAATQAKVTANMHGSGVLDVAQFATAKFVIHSVTPVTAQGLPGTPYQFDGELELHGVKRAIRFLSGAETIEGGRVRIRGGFTLKQTDFGITPYSKLLGAVGVADELRIYGDLVLTP